VLSTITPRHLRLLAAALRGDPQREAARREGVTQSAVSQALHSSGGQALVQALGVLGAAIRR
jgi:predicted transcriptional regulator